tara:strand:+ start:327 stop:665 length:339 start_codon:yes stop_codon:yes gene_type:complete
MKKDNSLYTFTLHDLKIMNDIESSMFYEKELTDSVLKKIVNEMVKSFNYKQYTEDDVFRIKVNIMYFIDNKYCIKNREERSIIESDVYYCIRNIIGNKYKEKKTKACICLIA